MTRCAAALAMLIACCAPGEAQTTVKVNYFACKSEREFDRGNTIRRSGDSEALQQWITGALLSGGCLWLKTGTPVYDEGAGKTLGNIKIRPKGEIQSYYTQAGVIP